MRFKKAVSLLTIAGLGCALSIAVMARRAKTAAMGPSNPAITGPVNGGFEFVFGGNIGGVCTSPWNTFFLNSNGNVSFGAGNGSQAAAFEFFASGSNASPLVADFDLRFEGANRFLATPKGQLGQSRDTLWWNGADCSSAGEFTCPK